jgi:hypothetical protein
MEPSGRNQWQTTPVGYPDDAPCPSGCSRACGVPKLSARSQKSAICRQDANFSTPHARRRDLLGGLIHEYEAA